LVYTKVSEREGGTREGHEGKCTMSEKQLQDKVALITGTSPNIGGGIAEGLAAVGVKVVCVDIHPENANQSAAAIVKRGDRRAE